MIGIIGAMSPEIDTLKHAMTAVKTQNFGNITVHTGTLDQKNVCLALSGIGKVNAAIATTTLIQQFNPQYIINTGSAGGLAADLAVGDVVIGTEISHHDVDVSAFGYVHGQVPQMTARFHSNPTLIQAACQAAQHTQLHTHTGLIASGDQFISQNSLRDTIRTHFPDVLAVEMEAAAIAQTCTVLNTPFVIIRAISDNANDTAHISFDEFLPIAAQNSANMVRALIHQINQFN